jgi:hypothetical protein
MITRTQRAIARSHIDSSQNSNCDPFSTGVVKNGAGRQLRRSTKEEIEKTVVRAGQTQWPGAGSNRRPSDFQDSGAVSVSDRHRP